MNIRISAKTTGLTLIEILVVMAILVVLTTTLLPVIAQARAHVRKSSCLANEKQVADSLLIYTQDYDENLPNAQWIGPAAFPSNWVFGSSIRDLMGSYTRDLEIFICPSDTELAKLSVPGSTQPFGLSYQFNGNPLGHGNNIFKLINSGDDSGKPMMEHNDSIALSYQNVVGDPTSRVHGAAMAEVLSPAQNWMFADAWPGVHGSETTSYFQGTRTNMMANENLPFRRSVNLVYVDGHAKFSNTVAAAWDTDPY